MRDFELINESREPQNLEVRRARKDLRAALTRSSTPKNHYATVSLI